MTQNNSALMRLQVSELGVQLGGQLAVRECTFEAEGGAFICIAGLNGAGKSTLLRALAGLIPYSGSIRYDARELRAISLATRSRMISYLPQDRTATWPLPVQDIVALGRMPFGSSLQRLTDIDRQHIQHAMRACGIEHLAAKPIDAISGGERARALLARMLAVNAPAIFADEPTAALDPAQQLNVWRALKVAASGGCLVVAVTHDAALAMRFATRLLLMEGGRLAGSGTPAEILQSGQLDRLFGVRFAPAQFADLDDTAGELY